MASRTKEYSSPKIYPELEYKDYPSYFPSKRKEAQEKGFNHYFSGKPCKQGHIALRRADWGGCLACGQIRAKEKRINPSKNKIIKKQRKQRYDKNRDEILKKGRERYKKDINYRESIALGKLRKYIMPNGRKMEKADYFLMLEKQKGKCKICGSKDNNSSRSKYFFVDHDHKSNVVRSLLCHNCNFMIGHFNDDKKVISKAIEYLKKHSE